MGASFFFVILPVAKEGVERNNQFRFLLLVLGSRSRLDNGNGGG